MLAIRLTRMGSKKKPSYRVIVTRKRYKRDGAYVENLGFYNPLTTPATISVDRSRFDYWVTQGAQPTDVIKRIVLGIKGTKKRAPKHAPLPDGTGHATTEGTEDKAKNAEVKAEEVNTESGILNTEELAEAANQESGIMNQEKNTNITEELEASVATDQPEPAEKA